MDKINDKCILIPTYNRAVSIEFYLATKLEIFTEAGFDIVVYDSSTDEDTKRLINKYREDGYENVIYHHYSDPVDDIYGVNKVKMAFVQCGKLYKYVWLCGDMTMLRLEEYNDEIQKLMNENYDAIHIYKNNIGEKSQCNIDCKEFLAKFYWSMTHWCSFILSSKFIGEMECWIEWYHNQKFLTTFVFPIYATLANGEYKIAYINEECYTYVPFRNGSVSYMKKDILRGHGEVNCRGIDALPEVYNEYKSVAKKSLNRNMGLFSKKDSIDLRATGNITFKKLLKYGKYVKQMTDVPMSWFYFLSFVPKSIIGKFSLLYNMNKELASMNQKQSIIVIYGMGQHGRMLYDKIKYTYLGISIDSVSDQNVSEKQFGECEIIEINSLNKRNFDYVVVAIVNNSVFREVRKKLMKLGIPRKKIIHL